MQSAQSDSVTLLPVNLSKDDNVKSATSTQSSTDDTKNNKTDEVYKLIVEPITPEPPKSEPPEPYQPLVELISPVQNSTDHENVPATGTTTAQSNIDAGTPVEQLNMSEPHSLYQPVVEPISPVQSDPNGESKTAAVEKSSVQPDDNVVTTTPPGSPPLMPGRDDGRQNTDDIDTEEYEDSISDNNTINGDNIPQDSEPLNTDMPANNFLGCNTEHTNGDNTTDVNVGNIPSQCTTSGDNKPLNINVDTNHDVTNGQNKEVIVTPDGDTNGHNILDIVSSLKDDTDMNSHNKSEPTPLNSSENRYDISPSPHSSNVSDVLDDDVSDVPSKSITRSLIFGSTKLRQEKLMLACQKCQMRTFNDGSTLKVSNHHGRI